MLFIVPVQFLADVKQFDPFRPVAGAPFQNPGAHEQGKELNNQVQSSRFLRFMPGGMEEKWKVNGWVGALRQFGSAAWPRAVQPF
jgi:hypothetical protein